VASVLRALNRAIEFEGTNPEEAAKKLIENKKVSTDDEALLVALFKSFRYDQHHSATANLDAKGDAIYFSQKLTEIGYLPADLDVNKFVDDMFVDVFALEKEKLAKK
jgi:NitT/TauT family transport system substrate-binding protein